MWLTKPPVLEHIEHPPLDKTPPVVHSGRSNKKKKSSRPQQSHYGLMPVDIVSGVTPIKAWHGAVTSSPDYMASYH